MDDTYGAWGMTYESTAAGISGLDYFIGLNNPFRYRRYYYDTETGFYYLNSRYYDPEVGRFLSVDSFVSTGQGLSGYICLIATCIVAETIAKNPPAPLPTISPKIYVNEQLRLVAGNKSAIEATLISLKAEIITRSKAGIRWE